MQESLKLQTSSPPRTQSGLDLSIEVLGELESFMLKMVQLAPSTQLKAIGEKHLATGGKRLRARLAIAAGKSLGVDESKLIPWAAACELLHNATLIHDDLQDQDRFRRGQKTVWFEHGVERAINLGDMMLMLPYACLKELDVADRCKLELQDTLVEYSLKTVAGQDLEADLKQLQCAEKLWSSYQEVCVGKTSSLFELPVFGAALIAGHSMSEARKTVTDFAKLGLIFQMTDDVLDVIGKKQRQSAGEDLREGKVSCLVIQYLKQFPDRFGVMMEFLNLSKFEKSPEQIDVWRNDFIKLKVLDKVVNEIGKIGNSIETSPVKIRWPNLHSEACHFLDRFTDPISDILQNSKEQA